MIIRKNISRYVCSIVLKVIYFLLASPIKILHIPLKRDGRKEIIQFTKKDHLFGLSPDDPTWYRVVSVHREKLP